MVTLPIDTDYLVELCHQNDIAFLGLFGSTSRGEATEQSDIDLFVKFSKRKGLLAIVQIEREFSKALGKKVDLVTDGAISPYIRDYILSDLKVIFYDAER